MTKRAAAVVAILTTGWIAGAALAQAPPPENTPQSIYKYWLTPPPSQAGVVERGRWLFRQKGCFLCHGPRGEGGVANPNYIKGTIPQLSPAEQMKLKDPGDAAAILEQLERGVRLETLSEADPPLVPRFNVVLAQYHSIRRVIQNGNPAGKKDPKGPTPPLSMPSWSRELSEADIDAIIAYLLSVRSEEEWPATSR